jgi:ubiquitin C
MVDPEDTIDDVKKQVEKKLGIPPEDQRPAFNDKPLPDKSTLDDNGIKHGDVIDLQPMEIKVRAPDGRTVDLVVKPEDTIPDIKKQVKKKLGIPPKSQRPTFKNKPLPDDSTLKDNGIKHGDVIDLQPMKIKVRAPDGRSVELDVEPDDTIPDIKKQVEDKLGIPVDEQRPVFNDEPLPDNSTLDDNGIGDGDVIDLEPMQINVRAPDGRTTQLMVSPEDPVSHIKKRVKKKLGIPVENQRPRFNGDPLPNDSTLDDNGIKHGDTIDLDPMEIKVRAPDGRTTELLVTPDDTIDRIKKRVKKNLGISPEDQRPTFKGEPLPNDSTLDDNGIKHGDTIDLEPMEIKVRGPDGRVASIPVTPDTPIDDIKDEIENKLGIPPEDQRPTFKGKPLPDDSTIDDNGIKHGDTIDLGPMEIKVRGPDGRVATIPVTPDTPIDDIKDDIEDKLGIPPEDQRPTFKGKPLPDNSTIDDNGIKHGDTIDLGPMEVNVRAPDGRVATIPVTPDTPIKDLKKKVKKDLGISPKDQRPTFNDKPLPDDSTLDDNGIKHGDTIDLEPMEIKVKAPDGRVASIPVTPDDTIDDIKKQVEDQLEIPPEEQRPTFKNKPLPDESTLKDNKIKHGDVIDLQPMEIKVRTPEGRVCPLTVDPDDTIEDIKDQVNYKLGIPPEDQRPRFKGNKVPDGSTLKDNDIRHGDVIDLDPMEIQVKAPDGRVASIPVNPYDTINDIKKKVQKDLGIPRNDQRPTLNGQPLPDKSTLKDNNIRHGDVIELQPMEIYVIDLDGNKGTYQVDPKDSIGDIKSRVEDETGVESTAQRLSFDGKILDDDDNTLKKEGIKHQDTLKLDPWRVHVRLPDGRKITFAVNPKNTTANDVKNMVKKSEGIMTKKQTLKHNGNELDDPTSLEDNGVQNEDTIDVEVAPPEGQKAPYKKGDLFKKADKPDRYGKVTVTRYKTRYDGEPVDNFIDGEGVSDTTDFKFEDPLLKSQMK